MLLSYYVIISLYHITVLYYLNDRYTEGKGHIWGHWWRNDHRGLFCRHRQTDYCQPIKSCLL